MDQNYFFLRSTAAGYMDIIMSKKVVLNSGAPQGCVLSPMLFFFFFFIYTNHIKLQTAVTCLFKFADVVAHVGLLLNEDSLATYFSHVSLLNEWCKEICLEMNVGKREKGLPKRSLPHSS